MELETLSRLPGKVSGCDIALNMNRIEMLLTRQKVIPLSGKVVFIWEKTRSRLSTSEIELFILFSYQGEISLVNLSKSSLANRDN